MDMWAQLQLRTARASGVRDQLAAQLEAEVPAWPADALDGRGGREEMEKWARSKEDKELSRPHNKRVRFWGKLSVKHPHRVQAAELVRDWAGGDAKEPYVLRDRRGLIRLEKWLRGCGERPADVLSAHPHALLPVKVDMLARGHPKRMALLCLPTAEDWEKIAGRHANGPSMIKQVPREKEEEGEEMEQEQEEEREKKSKDEVRADKVKEMWKDKVSFGQENREKAISLKDMFPDRVMERMLKRKAVNRGKRQAIKKRKLVAGERAAAAQSEAEEKAAVKYRMSSNREVCGRVVRGDFSFCAAAGKGLGFVPLAALDSIIQSGRSGKGRGQLPIVLVRNATSKYYHPARLEVGWMFKGLLSRLSTPTGGRDSPSSGRSTPAGGDERDSPSSPGWSAAFASDPTQWEVAFEERWRKCEKYLDRHFLEPGHVIDYGEMTTVLGMLSHMCQLLMMEVNAQPEPAIGPILDRFFTQQILERTLDWAIQIPDFLKPTCQLSLIRVFEGIVSESHTQNHCLLVHKPVLNPLFRLFDWCRRTADARPVSPRGPSATDKHFVLLLNQICTKMAEDRTLLHFFFTCGEQEGEQFIVFSLLIRFLYEQNDVGQLARDALLLILSVSATREDIAEFVADKSAFCEVVATGLSGCFSQLDRVVSGESFDRVLPERSAEALADYHSSLLFCNAVVQAAHPAVVTRIADYFYSGFLLSVVKPALTQMDMESLAAATLYLNICLETITEEALVRMVIRLVLVERDEQRRPLLQTVIERIGGPDKLAAASLSLLNALILTGCEDVLLVAVLRGLLPMNTVSRGMLAKVRDRAQCVSVARRLLACVPRSMLRYSEVSSPQTLKQYMREASELLEERASACASWKWRYDGSHPSPLLFRADSDEEAAGGGHSPFTRLSSCRSSLSSAAVGLNRYFATKGAHLTTDSQHNNNSARLAELGQKGSGDVSPIDSPVAIEDEQFVLPPITSSGVMTSSMMDYFQLMNYDDLSDEMCSSPEREQRKREQGGGEGEGDGDKRKESFLESGTESSGRGFDTDAEMARSFVLTGFADVEDMDTFMYLLDRRQVSKGRGGEAPSLAELTAFIDSKVQYMREKEMDFVDVDGVEVEKSSGEEEGGDDGGWRGLPVEEVGIDPCLLLEVLLSEVSRLPDRPLPVSLGMATLLATLAAHPQPLLIAFMFDVGEGGERRMIRMLETLRDRIDEQMAMVEGLDDLVHRAVRGMTSRCDRMERAGEFSPRVDASRGGRGGSLTPVGPGLTVRPHPIRYHAHKAVEPRHMTRNDEVTKRAVQAGILLSNLAQQLAAIAMQHAVLVVGRG